MSARTEMAETKVLAIASHVSTTKMQKAKLTMIWRSFMGKSIPKSRFPAPDTNLDSYVGNTMVTFVMQSLGCEVSALHTVHFSSSFLIIYITNSPACSPGNHTGYRQIKGTKATASEILDLYAGLQQSHLTDFDVLLSGYAPSAEAVQAVGSIARDLKNQRQDLFWGKTVYTVWICRSD